MIGLEELEREIATYRADGVATHVALFHCGATGATTILAELAIDGDELAQKLIALSLEDAQDAGTVATYSVRFRDAAGRDRGGRKWRVQGRGLGDLEPTEGPTREGQLAQSMRHNELLLRVTMETNKGALSAVQSRAEADDRRHTAELERLERRHGQELERLDRLIAARDAVIAKYEGERLSMRERFEDSEDRRVAREINFRTELDSLERRSRLMSSFEPLAPALLGRATATLLGPAKGGNGGTNGAPPAAPSGASSSGAAPPAAAAAAAANPYADLGTMGPALVAFLGTFTADQVDKVVQIFEPTQQLVFVQLMKWAWAEKERQVDQQDATRARADAVVHGHNGSPPASPPSPSS